MRARLGRFAVVGVVALVGAAPAWASHSHPATYSGAFTDGGAVSFNVSADGNAVTRIMFTRTTPCGSLNISTDVDAPIVDHAFSQSFGSITISGTFPAPQVAQGSMRISGCSPSPASYSWSATTTAAPAVTPTPTPTPTVTPVAGRPVIKVSAPTPQRLRRSVTVRVTANKRASVSATGTLDVQRTRTTSYTLRPTTARLAKGATAKLRLRIPSRPWRAIARALRNGRQVSAQVTVTGQGGGGSLTVLSKTIQLRRP